MQAVVIFEEDVWTNFLPLTYVRPVCELRCGTSPLWQKVKRLAPPDAEVHIHCRSYLTAVLRNCLKGKGVYVNEPERLEGKSVLFVNGRALVTPQMAQYAGEIQLGAAYTQGNDLLGAYIGPAGTEKVLPYLYLSEPLRQDGLQALLDAANYRREVSGVSEVKLLSYPWELIDHNAELISAEFPSIARGEGEGKLEQGAAIHGGSRSRVYIGRGSVVHPTVVIDVTHGPVYIGENVTVFPPTRVEGPNYIGDDTQIVGGKIREGCHIGAVCRVGGEVEETIIHGYTNKYHDGFLGHAYLCEWINIGALTTNSDLKDTYGAVRVRIGDSMVNAGTKVGCFIGDNVKTSIGVLVYTGKRIGFASHVHGVVTDDVPPFTIWAKSFGGEVEAVEILLDSVIETHKRVLSRRKLQQSPQEVELIKRLFDLTKEERSKAGVRSGRPQL